jgi:hypothetical protein
MGLDVGNAHWSYSGFNEFRRRLAAAIDIDLDVMEGFYGTRSWEGLTDRIVPLLNHSDCEGKLTASECRRVAPRLRAIIAPWPEGDYDKEQALLLVEDMETCAKAKEPLEFH